MWLLMAFYVVTRDFIVKQRSLPNDQIQIQIYQNEVHIKNISTLSRR